MEFMYTRLSIDRPFFFFIMLATFLHNKIELERGLWFMSELEEVFYGERKIYLSALPF